MTSDGYGGCTESAGRFTLVPALPLSNARYPDIQIDMGVSDRVDLIGDNGLCSGAVVKSPTSP